MERCCIVIALNMFSICGLQSTQYDAHGFDKKRFKIFEWNIISLQQIYPSTCLRGGAMRYVWLLEVCWICSATILSQRSKTGFYFVLCSGNNLLSLERLGLESFCTRACNRAMLRSKYVKHISCACCLKGIRLWQDSIIESRIGKAWSEALYYKSFSKTVSP